MITYLKGNIKLAGDGFVILVVQGVGYRVYTTHKTLDQIGNTSEEVELFIYQHIREDALDLFGFLTVEELDFFELIISVSGIGPRVGLAILEISLVGDIKKAIATADVDYLTRVPGIGRKKAELIILVLKNKIDILVDGKSTREPEDNDAAANALMRLGYSKKEATLALAAVPRDIKDEGERVKLALKEIGKK